MPEDLKPEPSGLATENIMRISIPSFPNGSAIPHEYAFCVPDDKDHARLGSNRNPHLAFEDVPETARSLTVLCVDPDVPSRPDDVNQEGRSIPHDLPRVDFYHWVLVDIGPDTQEIPAGADSDGVTARGKEIGPTTFGVRGRNDYTAWFSGDEQMAGDYGGYDGPCPPWNDERIHHYHFRLYALDVEKLDLSGVFGGTDALRAMEGHVIAAAEWVGTYTLNPRLL